MTEQELNEAIEETERQETLFHMAGDFMNAAWWACERVKLRGILYSLLMGKIR